MDNITFNFEQETSESVVVISDDKMRAALTLCRPADGESYTLSYLKGLLARNGVKYGLNEAVLQQMIDMPIYNNSVVVAKGQEPVNGKDGCYTYNFRTQAKSAPRILEDGSVDYLNMDLFESVTAGQVVAIYTHQREEFQAILLRERFALQHLAKTFHLFVVRDLQYLKTAKNMYP